jgi:hypothetical protein
MKSPDFGGSTIFELPKHVVPYTSSEIMRFKTHAISGKNGWGWPIFHTAYFLDQKETHTLLELPQSTTVYGDFVFYTKTNDVNKTFSANLRFIPKNTKQYLEQTIPNIMNESQKLLGVLLPERQHTLQMKGSASINAFVQKGYLLEQNGTVTPYTSDFDISCISANLDKTLHLSLLEAVSSQHFSYLSPDFPAQYPTLTTLFKQDKLSIDIGYKDPLLPFNEHLFSFTKTNMQSLGILR